MSRHFFGAVAVLGGSVATLGCGSAPDSRAKDDVDSVTSALSSVDTSQPPPEKLLTRFFTPSPSQGAIQQIADLVKKRDLRRAFQLAQMEATPQAVWFTDGSPDDVRGQVKKTVTLATVERRVPILVAYDIPFRDCAQYSAGGAIDTAAYEAWIDGFAKGVGDGKAVVILEPDSLGIIPYNAALDGTNEWCRPTITDDQGNTVPAPGAAPADRYAQLNYAVASLKSQAPNASIYLDGTHTAWLGAGEAAYRLAKAGAQQAQGFFVNLSNYQPTPQLIQYGTWISKCIYFANNPAEGGWRLGHYDYCASQYYPATPSDYSTWSLTDQWYADNVDNAANPPSGPSVLEHFVIDTSRNGQGPFNAAPYAAPPYNQPPAVIGSLNGGNWCNPPGAGLGLATTANTGVSLVDAYLWVKTPGQSDGSCDIAGGARAWDYSQFNPWGVAGDAQNHFDPLWGMVDPAAGGWFSAQALDLLDHANPPPR